MDLIREKQNNEMRSPLINDSHDYGQDVIENFGLTSPGTPGRQFWEHC